MERPPFRRAMLLPAMAPPHPDNPGPGAGPARGTADAAPLPQPDANALRLRLADLDGHLHCSIIGTCLSTAELRRLMAKFIDVEGLSDLAVHEEAVTRATHQAEVSRALNKALDRRHDAIVRRHARVKDARELGELWQQALDSGEVPGAYWAVLTHRHTSLELRRRAFGDVHMLSHLVGAAHRADIRRLVALERENAELRERVDRQQERGAELADEREKERTARAAAECRCTQLEGQLEAAAQLRGGAEADQAAAALARAVAVQTRRREEAENQLRGLTCEVERLQAELLALREHAGEVGRELSACEAELRARSPQAQAATSALAGALQGRRVLYVGGRPSSSAAIRDLVQRHGGEFLHHDGGLEDRKGMLAAALAGASIAVFPVDCIDHDSALLLKRSCTRLSVPFLALRTASVASFAAALGAWAQASAGARGGCGHGGPCSHHG